MVNISDRFVEKHNDYYSGVRSGQNKDRIVSPGSQYLIHLLKGGYLGGDYIQGRGRKILDVGCGSGFNCISFAMMGWQVYGCEITEAIAEHALTTIQRYGFDAEILVGENENIPFPEGMFDFLLSLNVIHYLRSEEAVQKTISEYARVLKPGGRFFLSTNHPENWILQDSEPLEGQRFRVSLPGDYRDGEILYLFNKKADLEKNFSPFFDKIMAGENRVDFFSRTLRHWILTGVKKGA